MAAAPIEASSLESQIQANLYFEAAGGGLYFIPLILEAGLGKGRVVTSAVSPLWDSVLYGLILPTQCLGWGILRKNSARCSGLVSGSIV